MKKSMVFIASSLALVIGISGCDFGSGSDTVSTLTKEQAAQAVATDDFIYVKGNSVSISEVNAGKEAYLITYNLADPSYKKSAKIGESVQRELSCNELTINDSELYGNNHIPHNLENSYVKPIISNSRASVVHSSDSYNYDEMAIGTTFNFIVVNFNNTFSEYTFEKKYMGQYCNVWYLDESSEKTEISINNTEFKTLADKFDSIYLQETQIFGSNIPTVYYSNYISWYAFRRRVNILVYDIKGDYKEGTTYGYVDFKDFVEREYENPVWQNPNSNNAECIYLDSYFLTKKPKEIYSTIAHEFQHVLYDVNKGINNKIDISTWSTEMMSMVAEEIFQKELEVDDINSPKNRYYFYKYQNVKGFTTLAWEEAKEYNVSGSYDYANTYAYGSYLLHYYGIPFIKSVCSNKYGNEESITKAFQDGQTFYTVLFRMGKAYIDGSLPAISSSGYDLDAVNLKDDNWTASINTIKQWFNMTDTTEIYESNPLIFKKNTYPNTLNPEGFFVNYLGTVDTQGSEYNLVEASDSNIYRFVYCK